MKMVRAAIDMYLETLAGYVQDDDKLVTYKWLSKELEVHVNVAKQILWEFWERHRQQVLATFMLMGTLNDGGLRVEVVKESDLTSAKQKFSKLISEHLYSLQKTLPDIELLAVTGEGDCRQSAVSCEECTERSADELLLLRWGSRLAEKTPAASSVKGSSTTRVDDKVQAQTSNGSIAKPTATEKKSAVHKTEGKQKAAFSNFFGKAANQQTKTKSPPTNNVNNKTKETSPKETATMKEKDTLTKTGKDNSVKNFFGKVKDKSPKDTLTNEVKDTSPEHTSISKVKDTSPEDTSISKIKDTSKDTKYTSIEKAKDESPKANFSKVTSPPKKLKKQSPTILDESSDEESSKRAKPTKHVPVKSKATVRGTKRQSSAVINNANKRRKRIIHQSDSSEESSSKEDEEPEGPPSPQSTVTKREAPPSPPIIKREHGKRKVRKMVDKTFEDENGYIVTQKDYVYETCSSEEEVAETKPSKPKPQPQQKKNTKQATLFNFYSKSNSK